MAVDQTNEHRVAIGNRLIGRRFSGACFGSLRLSTGSLPTDRLFTGQIRDLGDDRFYWFKSRYYDATIGKFQSPDPVPPDPKIPQGLNHYAYANNNPLKFRDSTGHATETPEDLVTPGQMINTLPPAPPNQPLVFVTPPLPDLRLIFANPTSAPILNVTTQPDLGLAQSLINTLPDLGSLIAKANSSALRANLEAALGRSLKDDYVAHHLIPGELEQMQIVQQAVQSGWHIDSEANGMELPNNKALSVEDKLPYQRGPHPNYTDFVQQVLDLLTDKINAQRTPDSQIPSLLNEFTDWLFFKLSEQGQTSPGSRLP